MHTKAKLLSLSSFLNSITNSTSAIPSCPSSLLISTSSISSLITTKSFKMSSSTRNRFTMMIAPSHLFLVVAIFMFGLCIESGVNAELCHKMTPSKQTEMFQCPRIFESKKKSWCCGANSFNSHCCEWSERAKEAGLSLSFLQASFKYVVVSLLVLFILVAFIWVLCCYASRQNGAGVFRGGGPSGWHRHMDDPGYPRHARMPGAPPPPGLHPPVPPYSAYPGGCGGGYSYHDQPPPYDQVYQSPPMAGAGQLNGNNNNNISAPPYPSIVPLAAAPNPAAAPLLQATTEQKDPNMMALNGNLTSPPVSQPPFNPSFN